MDKTSLFGVGDGFYIVLPLFGPSNFRDTSGMVFNDDWSN